VRSGGNVEAREVRRGLIEGFKGLALFFVLSFLYGVIRNKNWK
jgi:hypothetical protein